MVRQTGRRRPVYIALSETTMLFRLDRTRNAPFRRVVRDAAGQETGRVYVFTPHETTHVPAEDVYAVQRDLGKALWIAQCNAHGKVTLDEEATRTAATLAAGDLLDFARLYEHRADTLGGLLTIDPNPVVVDEPAPTPSEPADNSAAEAPPDEPPPATATTDETAPLIEISQEKKKKK